MELAAVVSGACRRAVRDEDRQIDTAHLLHSLLESDPEVCAVLGEDRRIARLLGYLVQRSIAYGLRWQSAVEDSGSVPVVVRTTGFSPLAAAGLECAREPHVMAGPRAVWTCSRRSSRTRRHGRWRCSSTPESATATSSPVSMRHGPVTPCSPRGGRAENAVRAGRLPPVSGFPPPPPHPAPGAHVQLVRQVS